MPANAELPDWVRDGAKARALAAFDAPPSAELREARRQARQPLDLPGGTVVVYSGSFATHHGLAVFVGPSGDYPAGQEVRYTLVFSGLHRLEGVGRGSFTPAPPDTDIPPLVQELADAMRRLTSKDGV